MVKSVVITGQEWPIVISIKKGINALSRQTILAQFAIIVAIIFGFLFFFAVPTAVVLKHAVPDFIKIMKEEKAKKVSAKNQSKQKKDDKKKQ